MSGLKAPTRLVAGPEGQADHYLNSINRILPEHWHRPKWQGGGIEQIYEFLLLPSARRQGLGEVPAALKKVG